MGTINQDRGSLEVCQIHLKLGDLDQQHIILHYCIIFTSMAPDTQTEEFTVYLSESMRKYCAKNIILFSSIYW